MIGRGAQWGVVPGARQKVDQSERDAPRPQLSALVTRRLASGGVLTVEELVAAGWPGERIGASSAAGRVYQAIATLRRLGLRDVIVRDGVGYALDPDLQVLSADEAAEGLRR